MVDWQYAMQAMVNLGRVDLANRLGFTFPHNFESERWLWNSLYWKLERHDTTQDASLDLFRIRHPDDDSEYLDRMRARLCRTTY